LGWGVEDGEWRMEAGGWRPEDGERRMESGGWKWGKGESCGVGLVSES